MNARLKPDGKIVDLIGPDNFGEYIFIGELGKKCAIQADDFTYLDYSENEEMKNQETINLQKPKRVIFEF
jgi:hypothetical protein